MADIFDEVSEDLRQDQILKFWRKYSKVIIIFIILIIVSVLSFQGYISWNKNQLNLKAEYFFNSLEKLEDSEIKKSIELFSNNPSKESSGYSMLSKFGLAQSNYENNDIEKMILNYQDIYDNKSIDNYYQYLARFLSVIKDNKSSYEQLRNRLKPILNSPNKLQILAAELQVILLIYFNMINEAKQSLKILLDRKDISFEQKNRLILIKKVYETHE